MRASVVSLSDAASRACSRAIAASIRAARSRGRKIMSRIAVITSDSATTDAMPRAVNIHPRNSGKPMMSVPST